MQLDLTDEEALALLNLLNQAIESGRLPPSPRIRTLRAIREKLPTAPQDPLWPDRAARGMLAARRATAAQVPLTTMSAVGRHIGNR